MTINVEKPVYVPSLRLKKGEILGASNTSDEINKLVIPRFVVPPKGERDERDQSVQLSIFPGQQAPVAGINLGTKWVGRTVLLDCRHVYAEFDNPAGFDWLTSLFRSARQAGINAVPVATINDLLGDRSSAYRKALALDSTLKLAVCADFSDLDSDFEDSINEALEVAGLADSECSVIADYSGADFSETETVASVLQGSLELLQEIGQWHHIAFSGSNYPNKNPAEESGSALVSRNEWLAWKQSVSFDKTTGDQLVFGDYTADCSKIDFRRSSGGRPHRHLRYTTDDAWFIARGSGLGKQEDVMRQVCKVIVDSDHYCGRGYSKADELIYQLANDSAGATSGSPTNWRAINIEHHITKVVRDIGTVRGFKFEDVELQRVEKQHQLTL